jgi:hypothetical protein
MQQDSQIEALIEAMTKFASTTKNDQLSVRVARVANRLQNRNQPFEKPLTRGELSVIRPFMARLEARAA